MERKIVNTTLGFYNNKASEYFDSTVNLDVSSFRDNFVDQVSPGGKILDFGCGSGRDSKYFIEQGFKVEALDGSSELCKLASDYIGINVMCKDFRDFEAECKYDGIWACSSLLHLKDSELTSVLSELRVGLSENGVLYMSFKLGDFEGYKDGRYFKYMNEHKMLKIIKELSFNIIDIKTTKGGLKDSQLWLSILLSK